MNNFKKLISLTLSVAMLLLSACSSTDVANTSETTKSTEVSQGSTGEASKFVEELKIGTTKPADSFNCMLEDGSYGKMNYNSFSMAPLLERNNKGEILPYIMTSWEIAEDGLSMTAKFATDKGIMWHDGKPLTIDDIIFTYEYLKDVKKSSYMGGLNKIEKIDDTTLKLTYTTPDIFGSMNNMAQFVYVYPKHVWENITDYKGYTGEDAVIGCGPYKYVSCDKDAQIVYYEAVDNYFKGELTVKKVSVRTYDSHDALIMALRNGEVDAMYDYSNSLDASKAPSITGVKNLDAGMSINPGNYQLVFGFNETPTNDINFRKAVTKALNYELLAVTIGGEDGEIPGIGVIAPPNKGFDESLAKLSTSVDEANKILDEAGYVDKDGDGYRDGLAGEKIEVLVTPQFNKTRQALYLRIAEIIIQNLDSIKVKAVLDNESVRNSDYCTEFRKSGKYELYIGYTSPGVAMYKAAFMYMVPNPKNPWGTCNIDEFNKAYDAMMASGNYDEYKENMKILQKLNEQYIIGLPLCWDKAYFPYRTDKYEGWDNQAGWGVINARTWYNLVNKK